MAVFNRIKAMGTAKFRVVAFDAKTRRSLINSDVALARSDYKHWNVVGASSIASGSVPNELARSTGESESVIPLGHSLARRPTGKR